MPPAPHGSRAAPAVPRRWAWLPIPLLLALIIGLRLANFQAVYESRALMLLLNVVFTGLAALAIAILAARGFRASGQVSVLWLGCGAVVWGSTSLIAAGLVAAPVNQPITVHNLGMLAAALCHFSGWLWPGRLARRGRWLVVGHAGAGLLAAGIVGAVRAGVTPVFFVQGQGGTPIRWVVLGWASGLFAMVAAQLLAKARGPAGRFAYWYGLGLALVATGLLGVLLLTVQGGLLGWVNRLTQYLGSLYLLRAAWTAGRTSGTWTLDLATELRLAEEKFTLAFNNNPVALALSRLSDGVFLEVNDTWVTLSGFTRAEALGQSARTMGIWPDPAAAARFVSALRTDGVVRGWEQAFHTKAGRKYVAELTAQLLTIHGDAVILVTLLDITARQQAAAQIAAALAEKEVLLKEIHHRVKNNLQIIVSLVNLQADGVTDARVLAEFAEIGHRVRAMALVHEALYQTPDLAKLNFADYAARLLHQLWAAHRTPVGTVTLTLAVAPVCLPADTAVTCGLLLNELASNTLKHAFPNGRTGQVTVGLDHTPATGAACLWVRDDGIGLPADRDWRQAPSLGLRLVQMLAQQLRGTVATGPGPGAEFRINFVII